MRATVEGLPELRPVTLAESAIGDFKVIRDDYCEQEIHGAGERFSGEILTPVEALPTCPEWWRIVPQRNQPVLRKLLHPPFRIVFRRNLHGIPVVRVRQSERRLKLPKL